MLTSSRDKNEGTCRSGEGGGGPAMCHAIKMKARAEVGRGEEDPLCDPGSELLLGGSARVVRG